MGRCVKCNRLFVPAGGATTGYGVMPNGDKLCYACCAEEDKATMVARGRIDLYLTNIKEHRGLLGWRQGRWSGDVTNWPGSLRYPSRNVKVGGHNIAGVRYDVWFIGPDDHIWYGVRYGNMTEIVHCRRTRRTIRDE